MKTLNDWLKNKIKQFLLFLIKQLDTDIPVTPKIRLSNSSIFKKEINIPIPLTIIISFVCIFFMLTAQKAENYMQIAGIFISLIRSTKIKFRQYCSFNNSFYYNCIIIVFSSLYE